MNIVTLISWISLVVLITGCATGSKDSILPQEGPTMKEVYEGHFTGQGVEQTQDNKREEGNTLQIDERKTSDIKTLMTRHDDEYDNPSSNPNSNDLNSYTRTAHNEIQQLFPRLRNKTLIMYVFPHLSERERHPVPGYSTAFTLYKQVEYALPGELAEGY